MRFGNYGTKVQKLFDMCNGLCLFWEGERVLFYGKDTSYLFNDVQEVFI